jgi:holo-[acyl-carrier protein] synthase
LRPERKALLRTPRRALRREGSGPQVLGTGWRGGIAWTDVEVIRESSGQPKIALTGECQRIAKDLGISRWHISISHIETHATASAIGMRGD